MKQRKDSVVAHKFEKQEFGLSLLGSFGRELRNEMDVTLLPEITMEKPVTTPLSSLLYSILICMLFKRAPPDHRAPGMHPLIGLLGHFSL
jgi:hypothetical protein